MKIRNDAYWHQANDEAIISILKSWVLIHGPDELHAVIDELAKEPEVVAVWGDRALDVELKKLLIAIEDGLILPILKYIINPFLFRLLVGLRGRK